MRPTCLLLVLWLGASALADEAGPVYSRAWIQRAASGTVTVAVQYGPRLDLPAEDCPDEPFSCLREQQYGQLYRIRFLLNEVNRDAVGRDDTVEASAGEIYLAADLDREQEVAFDALLQSTAAALNGDSFRHPYAGWGVGLPPFGQPGLIGSSKLSAWMCFSHGEQEREYRITPQLDGDALVGHVTTSTTPDTRGMACESLKGARRLEEQHRMSTPFHVGALVRTEIHASSNWYPGDTGLDALQPLPPEMEYEKTEADPQLSGSSMGVDDGIYLMERISGGVRQRMRLGAYDVRPPRPHSTAWVTRWTIETRQVVFGAKPGEETLDFDEVWILALPIADPLADDASPPPGDPGTDVLDAVVGSLDRAAQLTTESVAAAFQEDVAGAFEGDWMIVYCPSDDPPQYSIARFFGRSPMSNGDDVCDAVRGLYALP